MKSDNIIRIFISSTFCDFNKEREILNNKIFPALIEEFSDSGKSRYTLQLVDLRWGVPNGAEYTHETMQVCLRELKRSRELSPNSYLYIMLGDRYGWQPLPDTILCADYKAIQQQIETLVVGKERIDATKLFDRWYIQDLNSVDNNYILLPAKSNMEQWNSDEKLIRALLDDIYDDITLPQSSIIKYYYSATGQEIAEGALQGFKENGDRSVIPISCLFRSMVGCDRYVDIVDTKHKRVQEIINKLENRFPTERAVIDTTSDNYSYKRYLEEFESKSKALLSQMISTKIESDKTNGITLPYIQENRAHSEFCSERVENFVGRKRELESISRFVCGSNRAIVVVSGERGSGKSAFLSKVATDEATNNDKLVVVARFVGVSACSNNLFSLLCNICETVWRNYPESTTKEFKTPSNYPSLTLLFQEVLNFATPQRPLLIIIDALDQLGYTDNFKWIPRTIPESVKIVLGTRSEASYKNELTTNISRELMDSEVNIQPLDMKDSVQVLNNWLKGIGRKDIAQLSQNKIISDAIQGNKLPIYLKLLFEKIKTWHSFENITIPIKSDAKSMIIDYFFDVMCNTKGHSKSLIEHSLAYINLGENGVSEQEILELLARDEVVMQELKNSSFNDIAINTTIPFMIWARLYGDIEPYTKLILHNNNLNITFYHPLISEVLGRYSSNIHNDINDRLIAYYYSKIAVGNTRALSALPYHIKNIERDDRVQTMLELLLNDKYLTAKIESELIAELVSEFEWLLGSGAKRSNDAIQKLFVTIATVAENSADISYRKRLWDEVHSNMIFRFERTIHVQFFDCGVDLSTIKRLLPMFDDDKCQFINLVCLISKQNYYRRMGRISDALEIGDRIISTTTPDSFKAMIYYDKAYIDFLAARNIDQISINMEKSYQFSTSGKQECTSPESFAKGNFSIIVGNFITSRLALFDEKRYGLLVDNYLDYILQVLGGFAAREASTFGRNKLSNILEHIGLICYYNGDKEGAEEALKLFVEQPFVKESSDKSRQRLASAMLLALEGKYLAACTTMQDLITYRVEQVSIESRAQHPAMLIESIAQMYYLLCVWYKKEGLAKESQQAQESLKELAANSTDDNGNMTWYRANPDYIFNTDNSVTDKVKLILQRVHQYSLD